MAFYDFTTFPNNTPLPPALVVENGTFNILFGQLAPTGSFPNPFWICTQESSPNGSVFATHRINPGGNGLVIRCIDKDNLILLNHNSNGDVNIIERVAGVETIIAQGNDPTFNPVKEYSYIASFNGENIIFSVGGAIQVTATTSYNLTETKHGIVMASAAGSGIYSMQIPDVGFVPYRIATIGQSNISGRGTNAQPYTPFGGFRALLFGNNYKFKELVDPYDTSIAQVDLISSDSFPGGSWIPKFCTDWVANRLADVIIIPCPLGGTTVQRWQKDSVDRVGGLNLYESLIKRATLIDGVDSVFIELGETDAEDITSTTKSVYKSRLITLAEDIFNDLGVVTYMIPLHTITQAGFDGNGFTTGQNAIREAQLEASAESAYIYVSPTPLTDIDISSGDGLHFKSDANLTTVGARTFIDFADYLDNFQSSTLRLTVEGIPNGVFLVTLDDAAGNRLDRNNQTFNAEKTEVFLSVAIGTTVKGYVDDSNIPSENGAYIEGITS